MDLSEGEKQKKRFKKRTGVGCGEKNGSIRWEVEWEMVLRNKTREI